MLNGCAIRGACPLVDAMPSGGHVQLWAGRAGTRPLAQRDFGFDRDRCGVGGFAFLELGPG